MSHDDEASVLRDSEEITKEMIGKDWIEMGVRLIAQEDRYIRQQRAGKGQPLPLASGQPVSVLPDGRLQASWQGLDPLPEAGPGQCLAKFAWSRRRPGEAEVGLDGRVEDVCIGGGEADGSP